MPSDSLLLTYRAPVQPEAWDHYADCFVTVVQKQVSLADYLLAFYDSPPFRLERRIIGLVVKRPSTAAHVRALASGSIQEFSAWTVLARTDYRSC